jgi:glycerol-3-phosphate acyltransferase PlsX
MIAVDAMGGDYAPQEAVKGALAAAKSGVPLILFGNQEKIISLLTHYCPRWRALPIELVHCSDIIGMDDDPIRGVMRKKNSSIVQAMHAVLSGRAKAFVSAGNSGAVVTAASIIIGRVPGVLRAAIGSFLPSSTGSFFCLDLGANPDTKPEHLLQFAYMGHAYVCLVRQIAQPTIALLSNGHEPCKGSMLVKNTFEMLEKTSLSFMGNIESRDIFSSKVDVVVTDGFTGNVLLKGIQGTANAVMDWMKDEASKSLFLKILLFFSSSLLSRIKKRIDYSRTGGALLLGIKQPVVIAHGSSKAQAITQAISFAHQTVKQNTIFHFNEKLQSLLNTTVISLKESTKKSASYHSHT